MKILFIYPKFRTTFWGWEDTLPFVGKKAAFPPVGFQAISAMMPKTWEKRLVDLNIENLSDEEIKWADYICVSAMSTQEESAKDVFERCEKNNRPVILGGPILKMGREKFPNVGHFFYGEAEAGEFSRLLRDMEIGCLEKVYQAEKFPDLGNSPAYSWDLIRLDNYASVIISVTRGCPHSCGFCDVADINGRVPRTRPECAVFEEFDNLYARGYRGAVLFADDNVVGNKSKACKFLSRLADWQKAHKYPFEFTGEFPITIADDIELMDVLVAAGFKKVFLGLETPNKASLIECNKMQNASRNMKACVKSILSRGLIAMSGFIVGFDSDHEDSFDNSMVEFIQDSGIAIAMVGVLQAVQGTAIYSKMKQEGRLKSLPSGNNTDCYPNFVPKMPVERLVQGFKNILQRIYSPAGYYKTICRFLDSYNPSLRPKKKLSPTELKALAKATFKIGLFGGPRTSYYYWKSLLRVVFSEKRRAFPDVVALQIYGVHLRRIAKCVKDL